MESSVYTEETDDARLAAVIDHAPINIRETAATPLDNVLSSVSEIAAPIDEASADLNDVLEKMDEPSLDLGALMEDGILGELSEEDAAQAIHEPGESLAPVEREEVGYVPQVGMVPVKRNGGKTTYLVPSRDDLVINRDVFRLVRDLKSVFDKIAQPICKQWGVTHSQFEAMREIGLKPGMSGTELSRKLNLQRSNTASLCKKLIEKNYLTAAPNAHARRGISMRLTDEGTEVVEGIERELIAVFDMNLSASRRDTFEKIIVGMNAMRELLAEMHSGQPLE